MPYVLPYPSILVSMCFGEMSQLYQTLLLLAADKATILSTSVVGPFWPSSRYFTSGILEGEVVVGNSSFLYGSA